DALAVAHGEADAVDSAELLGFHRRLAGEQLAEHGGGALARIFLDELFDGEERLCGVVSIGLLLPRPALRGERVGVRGCFSERDSRRVPLTRRASRVDLSPRAGRGGDRRLV